MEVRLAELTKRFGAVTAVETLDLDVKSGEFVALLGPSGCGKTTTLLMIAGIYRPTSGSIFFGERRVEQLHPRQRGIGMVFQSYALYPHMTVEQNIAFPLDVQRGTPKAERRSAVREAAQLVRVGELLDRRPAQLSGGQQQRVALARALAKRPHILLLDEPLSNLDARLRHEMRGEIKRLQKEVGITSVFVTHDQHEALTMADRVAVLNDGRLEAYETPQALYDAPNNRFVAEFIGDPRMNMLSVNVARRDGGFSLVSTQLDLPLQAPPRSFGSAGHPPEKLTLGVRPEHLRIVTPEEGDARGEIYVSEPSGREQLVEVRTGDDLLRVIAPADFGGEIGESVGVRFDRERLHLFDAESGSRI